MLAVAIAIAAVLAIGGGVLGFLNWRESRSQSLTQSPAPPARKMKQSKTIPPLNTSPATTPAPSRPPPPNEPKSPSDLKTGIVNLEKATGSSLVYAVGMLTNASGHQRYGVRIEIALTDTSGKPAGIAKDYKQMLDPGETWRFRALILDSRAKSGTVTSITEDP